MMYKLIKTEGLKTSHIGYIRENNKMRHLYKKESHRIVFPFIYIRVLNGWIMSYPPPPVPASGLKIKPHPRPITR